jgi:hypothetical protein
MVNFDVTGKNTRRDQRAHLMEAAVRTFEIQFVDSRYSAPKLKLVVAGNLDGAREEAVRILNESAHHLAVRVYLRSELVFSLERIAEGRAEPAPASSPPPQTAAHGM